MKYVVIRTKKSKKTGNILRDIPVIFSNDLSHIDVVQGTTEGA